jgi:hypothetical protein
VAPKNPYSSPAREQHPVEVTKVWPNAPLPSPTPLPGKTTETTPTSEARGCPSSRCKPASRRPVKGWASCLRMEDRSRRPPLSLVRAVVPSPRRKFTLPQTPVIDPGPRGNSSRARLAPKRIGPSELRDVFAGDDAGALVPTEDPPGGRGSSKTARLEDPLPDFREINSRGNGGPMFEWCTGCLRLLPVEAFAGGASRVRCRSCRAEANRQWRAQNPEAVRAYNESRRIAPRECTCVDCGAVFTAGKRGPANPLRLLPCEIEAALSASAACLRSVRRFVSFEVRGAADVRAIVRRDLERAAQAREDGGLTANLCRRGRCAR